MEKSNDHVLQETAPLLDSEIAHVLEALGERLRALRARRGISRRVLSRDSAVSERYLAQLESGAANPSLTVLLRICDAADVSLDELLLQRSEEKIRVSPLIGILHRLSFEDQQLAYDLLMQHFPPRCSVTRGIALVGLRGAGKSTLGQHLAERCQLKFVRLGRLVERISGFQLDELFALGGQKAYRRLERRALQHVLDTYPLALVEAGGSLVSEPDVYELLLNNYFTVWVKATPEEHMARVIAQGDLRPMAGSGSEEAMNDLRSILREREPYYRSANATLDTSHKTVDECLVELEALVAPILAEVAPV